MKRLTTLFIVAAATTLLFAQAKTNHVIRVEIFGGGEDGSHVNMTLPINALAAFEPTVRQAFEQVAIEGHGINLAEIWKAVKDSGPMDYVEIEESDSTIRVSTTGTHVVVRAEGALQDNINVSIPFELCDAVFRQSEDFDFDHLMTVLNGLAGQDLVHIDTENEQIRIWIE